MALYREYRPRNFDDVVSQTNIIRTLRNAISQGSFAHAYLFTGPRGTGKTSVARIVARAINCPNAKDGNPCNECDVCKQFLSGSGLDMVEIDAASNTGVENIRDITEHLKFSPTQAKYKVFIIDEVHMLSKGAFNALLKTLEEPPAHAVFILATTEIHKVPATVISRTQRFDFRKIKGEDLLERLKEVSKKEKIKIDSQSLELVSNAAEGSLRDALSILDKLSSFGEIDLEQAERLLGLTNVNAVQRFLDLLIESNAQGSLDFLEESFSSGIDPIQFNKDFLEYLRKMLMVQMGANVEFAFDQHQLSVLNGQAKKLSTVRLLNITRLFLRANKDFQTSPSLELPMEIAAAEACLQQNPKPPVPPSNNSGSGSVPVEKPVEKPAKKLAENKKELPYIQIEHSKLIEDWPAIMQEVKERASTLFAVLKNARLKPSSDNVLFLSFDYKFHKDSIENAKNRELLQDILEKRFKTPFSVRAVVEKEDEQLNDASNAVLEAFGGEVV